MSWRSINWYEVDAEEFYEAVEQVVETYAAAEKHISRTVAERLSAADQNVKKARTEEDSYLAHQLRDYEESVGARRTALLAGMAFSTLVALFLGTLGQLHKRLASNRKSIHETRVRAKTKIVWVAKFAQFGIDLHDGPTPLPYFEELLYARDSFLHEPHMQPNREYRAFSPHPKYVDEYGNISATSEQLAETVEAMKIFIHWVVNKIDRLAVRSSI